MSVTIHVLGNLNAFQQGLVGVQMLFNPANNTAWASGSSVFGGGGLILVGLLVSTLVILTKGVFTQKLELHHIFMLAVVYGIMFVPTTDVVLDNVMNGQQAVVHDIPVGIAYPAAIATSLSYDAGLEISQAYQSVNNQVPPVDINQGFVAPLQTLFQMRNLYSSFSKMNPDLAASISRYAAFCTDPNSVDTFNNTTDMLGSPGDGHEGLFSNPPANAQAITYWTNQPVPAGTTVTCQDDARNLSAAMAAYMSDMPQTGMTATCSQTTGSLTSNPIVPSQDCATAQKNLNNLLVNASQGVGTIMTAAGDQAQNFLTNIIAGCAATRGWQWEANPYGDPNQAHPLPSYCGLDTLNLNYQQIINAASANSFEQNMLPMMSLLQFMFFALAPLVAGVMVMMGAQGFGVAVKFLLFGAWTQSWLPFAVIISDWQQMTTGSALGKMALALAGPSGSPDTSAFLVQGAQLSRVFEKVAIQLSTSNLLLALTPLFSMAVISGSMMALSGLAKSMDGGASTKNDGQFNATTDSTAKAYGVSSNAAGEYFQTNPLAQSASVNIGSAAQSSISAMHTKADQSSMSAMQSAGRVGSSVWSVMDQAQQNTAAMKDLSMTGGQQWADTFKSVQGFAHETGLSDSQAASFLAQVGAGLNSGMSMAGLLGKADQFLANAGVKANLSGEERGQIQNALKHSDVQKTARDLSSQHTASLAQQVAQKYNIGDQASKSGSLTRQAQETQQEAQQAQQQYQKADQLQHQFSKTGMLQSGLNLSASTLAGTLLARYGSAPAAISAANSMAARAGVGDAYDKAVTAGKASGMSSETAAAYGLVMALPQAKNAEGFEQIADLAGAQMPAGAAVAGDQIAATQNSVNLAAGQFHAPDQSKVSDKGFKALKKAETGRQKAYQPVNQTGIASSSATPTGLYKEADQGVVSTPPGGIDPKKEAAVTGAPMVEGAAFMAEHPVGTMVAGMAADALGGVAAGKAAWNKYQSWKRAQEEKAEKAPSDPGSPSAPDSGSVEPGAAALPNHPLKVGETGAAQPALEGADPNVVDIEARFVPEAGMAPAAEAAIGAATGIGEVLATGILVSQAVDGAERMANSTDPKLVQHQLDAAYKADGLQPLSDLLPPEGSAKGGDK
ncbi:conjugal transfer protein TraG N-terminal domain-containing protein [Thiomonas sp.]|jgi:conjugal transfer mating pair stabilization protein TraG|uniref:conjugal transfer protein TraG N-terminal domain-containing protein n=1 Tax=Thiomonas sp. TaxID=2047785 RepID=UPI00258B4EB3|nr:conjugal transfer protein TraG N-terminal domain-containing protein [Thiomonas sp.]